MANSGKVFVVDDQHEVIELLSDLLSRRNRQTQGFSDGDAALAALDQSHDQVDLVVLDLDLGPGRRDGMAILADLRKRYPDLPCVILTGKAKVDDAVKAMRLGAHHPMGPFELMDLIGVDICVDIMKNPKGNIPETLITMVKKGFLGRKSGKGFYEYETKI